MKKTNIILLLIMIAVLTGCMQWQNRQNIPENQNTQTETYITGTEGATIRFLPNLPPEQLYDTEPFTAMIEITNEGASQIGGPGDRVYLSGFDPSIITGIPTTGIQIPKLEGRSVYAKEPETNTITFKGRIKNLRNTRIDKYPLTLLATACYSYETTANAGVCIDPNPHSPTTKQKVCTPEDIPLGTQGAPIAVEGIDVVPSKGTTRFRIHISNVGQGDVFRNGIEFLQKCSPYSTGLDFEDIDYVQIGDIIVGGTNIRQTCKPLDKKGNIKLTDGRATVICELKNIRGQTPYTTPITITLKYGYRTSIFQDLEIIPAN
ncbi:hypothetical protein DRJ25_00715 [Candidatus Woesearchaeota archaeon]|nr:MAG: hypothetical protein DRJ25_00715 [Candidatus Woesearchaeota archaeon]